MKYLSKNNYGYYSFRIKVPMPYRCYFNQTEIIKSLQTKSYDEARKLCTLITAETLKLLQTLKLGIFPQEQEKLLVNQFLSKVLKKPQSLDLDTTLNDAKPPVQASTTIKEVIIQKNNGKTLEEIVSMYLKNIPQTTSQIQKKAYESFYNDIFFELVDKKTFIKDIDRERLLEMREIIQELPRRNIQKYRSMKLSKIIKKENIKDEDKLSLKTINDYLKWIMSLFSFAQKYGYLNFNPAIDLRFKSNSNAKNEREIFSDEELKKFTELNREDENMKLFHYTLFYTGMINSEFLQAKISKVDGIECFDLTSRNLKLKTMARHRLIPIHSHLLRLGVVDKLEYIQKNYTADYLSKWSNEFITKNVSSSSKKVLYSFRHTFATKLQNNMIEEARIAQLMGHAKKGMTFGRYAKGYVADNLKEAIETLEFPSS